MLRIWEDGMASENKVGDLVSCGFGIGAIIKKEATGDCHVEWYCEAAPRLRTRFDYYEIQTFKEQLKEEMYAGT